MLETIISGLFGEQSRQRERRERCKEKETSVMVKIGVA